MLEGDNAGRTGVDDCAQLPPLYGQESTQDPTVHLKLLCPRPNWTWFATEGSQEGDVFLFFGYAIGFEEE